MPIYVFVPPTEGQVVVEFDGHSITTRPAPAKKADVSARNKGKQKGPPLPSDDSLIEGFRQKALAVKYLSSKKFKAGVSEGYKKERNGLTYRYLTEEFFKNNYPDSAVRQRLLDLIAANGWLNTTASGSKARVLVVNGKDCRMYEIDYSAIEN